MRDYTVPHTKGEDFREKLLNFSLLWPLVAAFLGVTNCKQKFSQNPPKFN